MDGVGVAPNSLGNALSQAQPKNLIKLWEQYPRTYLEASEEAVGLVENTNGNSEVGHLTIGSGKIHYQNLLKINKSIEKGLFFSNSVLKKLIERERIHLMGCLSDGAVHSHINHFFSVLEFLKKENYKGQVYIHVFTDGRDVPQQSACVYLKMLQEKIDNYQIGTIATICGRAYAMDRNNNEERTAKAYNLIAKGAGHRFQNWQEGIEVAYKNKQIDEYLEPILLSPHSTLRENDGILFLNFRPDRAIQLSKKIVDAKTQNLFFAGMVEYAKGFPQNVLFPKEYLSLPLGRVLSEAGMRQLRLAESEKYPHVTYFFNGGQPVQFSGEERINIPSPKVNTYDMKPEMSAYNILNSLSQSISNKNKMFNFILVNFANGDMVGHTGNLEASKKAVEVLDDVVSKSVNLALKYGYTTIITSDHGNVERMIEPSTNLPNTEHTKNPVPFLLIDEEIRKTSTQQLKLGSLSDIAPTILKLMNIKQPATMSGKCLLDI